VYRGSRKRKKKNIDPSLKKGGKRTGGGGCGTATPNTGGKAFQRSTKRGNPFAETEKKKRMRKTKKEIGISGRCIRQGGNPFPGKRVKKRRLGMGKGGKIQSEGKSFCLSGSANSHPKVRTKVNFFQKKRKKKEKLVSK